MTIGVFGDLKYMRGLFSQGKKKKGTIGYIYFHLKRGKEKLYTLSLALHVLNLTVLYGGSHLSSLVRLISGISSDFYHGADTPIFLVACLSLRADAIFLIGTIAEKIS